MSYNTVPLSSDVLLQIRLLHPQYFPDMSPVELKALANGNGFELLNISEQPDSGLTALHLRHAQSGLLFISLHAEDNHHYFNLALPTPPTDSSGLPHILEHSVLSGSAKFPLGDPFFEMTRSLILSEANASTARDHTRYYVSSTDRFSFFTAASIFLDALLHSNLTQEVFHRERGHLKKVTSEKGEQWVFDGVVYNEMTAQVANAEYSKMMARYAVL